MDLKKCSYCKFDKPYSQFNKDNVRGGLQRLCKDCNKKRNRYSKEKKAKLEGRTLKAYQEKPFYNLQDEELLDYMRKFYLENDRPPSSMDFDGNHDYPHAYTYYRRFKYNAVNNKAKGWSEIIKLAGLDPIDYDKIWTAWEYLVEIAVKCLRGKCIFQPSKLISGYRPDVVLENQMIIIDAATSNYDSIHKVNQYKKATEAGYKVEYWCLYKTTKNGIDEPGLTYVFSDEIVQGLRKIGEFETANDIQKLLEKHEDYAEKILLHRKEYIKEMLLKFYKQLNRTPKTRDLINEENMPSAEQIKRTFSSFNNALVYAGIPIARKSIPIYDEKIAVDELIELTKKLGRIPTNKEVNSAKKTYTTKVYHKYFGGIEKCLKQHSIDVEELKNKERDEMIKNKLNLIESFYIKNNRFPSQKEYRNENGLPSYHWVHIHFKSLKVLERKILEVLNKEK